MTAFDRPQNRRTGRMFAGAGAGGRLRDLRETAELQQKRTREMCRSHGGIRAQEAEAGERLHAFSQQAVPNPPNPPNPRARSPHDLGVCPPISHCVHYAHFPHTCAEVSVHRHVRHAPVRSDPELTTPCCMLARGSACSASAGFHHTGKNHQANPAMQENPPYETPYSLHHVEKSHHVGTCF